MEVFLCILIPFLGTVFGSSFVFFLRKGINRKLEIIILSFAAGVMMAAAVWSLLVPSIEVSGGPLFGSIGFVIGILIFYYIDKYMNKKNVVRDNMLLAVNIHNIPEGMAVGVVLSSLMLGSSVTFGACISLAIGVAIQNIPEGMIVSLPLYKKGKGKFKSFKSGVFSALYESFGCVVTILFTSLVSKFLAVFLGLAAGAMVYVVITELIPESKDKNNTNVIGFSIGFLLMMILDVML